MNNNTKIIIGASVLIVTGTAGYFAHKEYKKKQLLKLQDGQVENKTTILSDIATRIVPGYVQNKFPIGLGMKGTEVRRIQFMLNKKFNAGLKIDGLFGKKTEAALMLAIGKKTVSAQDFAKYARYE